MIRNEVDFSTIDLNKFCCEKTFEICAVKLNTKMTKKIACCIYRSPSRNLDQFYKLLEEALKSLYQPTLTLLLCGDFNINFLTEN
jgi:hypothetical protein